MSLFYQHQHQANMQMQSRVSKRKEFCLDVVAQGSGCRTGGAGLLLLTLCCFDAERGSCGISDLRLLLVLPFEGLSTWTIPSARL